MRHAPCPHPLHCHSCLPAPLAPARATCRVHGIKSGKMLKEFRGHSSFVNAAVYSPDGSQVVSAGADATVRVWDAKSCDCTFVFRPPQASATGEAPVVGVLLNPQNVDQMLVCPRGPTLYLMTLQGQVGGVQG